MPMAPVGVGKGEGAHAIRQHPSRQRSHRQRSGRQEGGHRRPASSMRSTRQPASPRTTSGWSSRKSPRATGMSARSTSKPDGRQNEYRDPRRPFPGGRRRAGRGRSGCDRLRLHRRADLASARAAPDVQRHPRQPDAPVDAGGSAWSVSASRRTWPTATPTTARGGMLSCEHATSRVTRTEADGTITVLATHYRGKATQQPQRHRREERRVDLLHRSHVRTHALLRRRARAGARFPRRLSDGRGRLRNSPLLADDFAQPNGLCFSRDERRLFVNDTERGHIRVFDVGADGLLSGGAVWAEVTGDRRRRARRNEGRPRRQPLLLRSGRAACPCAGRSLAGRDPDAGGDRQLHLGRGRLSDDLPDRFLDALSRPIETRPARRFSRFR